MKITIIGAGNMGGALARALARQSGCGITLSTPRLAKAEALRSEFPNIELTSGNAEAVLGADVVFVAVKPHIVREVLAEIKRALSGAPVVSLAAGVSLADMRESLGGTYHNLFRLIPNTALAYGRSMNLLTASSLAREEDRLALLSLLAPTGRTICIEEKKLDAATAIASCGIAYVLKYIQAATQAGTELGLTVAEARLLAAQAASGAAEILLADEAAHPMTEIDRVTTPGGRTIKGINALERGGFATAVIDAVKASSQ